MEIEDKIMLIIAIPIMILVITFTVLLGIAAYQSFFPEKYNIRTNNIEIKQK